MSEEADDTSRGELIINERETEEGTLVAACDADVLGETFENGEVSLTVEEDFYAGEAVGRERIVESLANCVTANLVGTEVVALAIEEGFVEEENVLDLDGTCHAQLLWM
jgi:hypothetical protein